MNTAGLGKSRSEQKVTLSGWRLSLALYFISLVVYGGISVIQTTPGYMDADYYYAGGLQIARGEGFWEPFLWNYLDDPQAIPHPSHAYWMPLASLIAALGMVLSGSLTFNAAQAGMIVLAASIPPLTAFLAQELSDFPEDAILAGALALFSGFYFPYLTTTDTFGIVMLLGALFLWLVSKKEFQSRPGILKLVQPFGLGILTGLMHLARADGLVWLLVCILVWLWLAMPLEKTSARGQPLRSLLLWVLAMLAGYMLVMGPWMVRNLLTFGAPLAPGGSRALWLTNYDELYIYPASELTFQRWLQTGFGSILAARWQALLQNVQTMMAVQGQIFLAPLILAGTWKLRHDIRVKIGLAVWGLTLFVMTLVFPYQGARGGLFHSGSAIQPLFWALAPLGLRDMVSWGAQIRGWNPHQALRVFQVGLAGLAIFLTALLVAGRVVGDRFENPQWNRSLESYEALGGVIDGIGAQARDLVLVNNAPGFFIATGRPALSVPYGSLEAALQVSQRYQACYLLLEPNHPSGLDPLYQMPGDRPGLNYLRSVNQTHLFRFESCPRASE